MIGKRTSFANGEFFHIYNRGVDKRIVFNNNYDLDRFLQSMVQFNVINPIGSLYENSFRQLGGPTPKSEELLVNIVAYCLNPNHFHIILEQVNEGGVSEYMKRLGGGYTSYFNSKNDRSGSLFQGRFKVVHIDSNEYLLHVSAYVNLNDRVHQLGNETPKLVESRSSWREYIDDGVRGICEQEIILGQFKDRKEYEEFALSSLELSKQRKQELKDFEKFLLE